MIQGHRPGTRHRGGDPSLWRYSERGASLILALAFTLGLGVIIAALLAYSEAASMSTDAFRDQRLIRYKADGAIEQGVAWAAGKPLVAVDDPATAEPCFLDIPATADTPRMSVTCQTTPGSGSGLPKETGSVPEWAILTTGQRENESPAFNDGLDSSCIGETGVQGWDNFIGLGIGFAGSNRIERGIRFSKTTFACVATRPVNQWTVDGKVFSNSPVLANPGGGISLAPGGSIQARGGCQNVSGCTNPADGNSGNGYRTNSDPMDPSTSMQGHDPRTDVTKTAAQRASWNLPDLSGLQKRSVPAPNSTICGAGKTVIFEPGWYDNAQAMNTLFKSSLCKSTTFWFAPARGTDGQLLGENYKQGLYYFDFTDDTSHSCNYYGNGNQSARNLWCIGHGYDYNQLVVGGTPFGWNPFGDGNPGTPTAQLTTSSVDFLNTSPFWGNQGSATSMSDGGAYAQYNNEIVAVDRPFGLENFGPKVASGTYTGGFNIKVSHYTHTKFNDPRITVRYDSNLFGSRTCGTFTLHKRSTPYTAAAPDQLNAGDQIALGRCLDHSDKINTVEITWNVGGCNFLCFGDRPRLDGMVLEPGGYPDQPSFPRPVSGDDPGGDCDDDKPGVMFVFGGDTHVYVADGSMELCAGPAAQNTTTAQQIALYNVPQILPVRATNAFQAGGNTTGTGNVTGARRIAEPDGPNRGSTASITYNSGNCGFCADTIKGGITMTFPKIQVPSGTQIERVLARATYNSVGFITEPQLELPGCTRNFPTSGFGAWLGISGNGQTNIDVTNCLSGMTGGGTFNATWWARGLKVCAFWICGGPFTDYLDGVEFIVEVGSTTAGNSSSPTPVPAKGCVIGGPNYWGTAQNGSAACALVKADQTKDPFNSNLNSRGRITFKGTVYAPSGAIDIDDEDVLYPFFNRGLVARTLMLRGFRYRINTPVVDIPTIDRSVAPREATFAACVRGTGRANVETPCDELAGDKVYVRAKVRFEIDENWPDNTQWARVPKVQWWSVNR